MTLLLDRVIVREGARTLLDDVSLRIDAGDFVALVGPNGAGKSTLLRTALGLLRPVSGSVRLGGDPVAALRGRDRAARASWLPQRSPFHEPMEVLDFVAGARFRFDEGLAGRQAAALRFLERAGAVALASRDLSMLSGGEQQRVAIAGLLAQEAPLLLLDEPAAHLDPRQQIEVHRLLAELWREGRSILCATHDLNVLGQALPAEELGRVRVVGLREGRVRFSSPCDSPALAGQLGALFDVSMHVIESDGRRCFVGSA